MSNTDKWAYPAEWLASKINESDDPAYLRGVIVSLLSLVDSDQIQDAFQSDMIADSYFVSLEDQQEADS